MKGFCSNCYKENEKCECTLDKLEGNRGYCSKKSFGVDSISHEYIKMDDQLVLKLKLWNDIIYLGHDGIEHLNSITQSYIDVTNNQHDRKMKDWECDNCGEKTNNGQYKCDSCLEDECDC